MFEDLCRKPTALAGAILLSLIGVALPAAASDHEIRMLSQGPDHMMQFDPELLRIAPGDTVHFVATDKGHSAQSLPGMTPDGAEPFNGPVGQDLTVTLTVEGVYGYGCLPHSSMGMVGLIVVGHPTNEDAAKSASVPGLARHTLAKLFQQLDSRLASGN